MSCHLFVRSLPARVRAALLCCLFVLSGLLPVMPTAFAADVVEATSSASAGDKQKSVDNAIKVTFTDLYNKAASVSASPTKTSSNSSSSSSSNSSSNPVTASPAPLSAARVQELLSPLPPLPQDATPAFRIPQSLASAKERSRNGFTANQSLPPEAKDDLRTGLVVSPVSRSVSNSVPRPAAQPVAARMDGVSPSKSQRPKELTVSRISHSGPVDEIRQLAITFSQPMVAIGQGGKPDVASLISLTPQPPGSWHWAGDRTLIFTPAQQRMPQATRYEVKINEKICSIAGAKLAKPTSWTIETPAAKLVEFAPDVVQDGAVSTKPTFVARFDQSVDANAVLRQTRLMMGGHAYALKMLDRSKVDLLKFPSSVSLNSSPDGHWFAFTPMVDLPRDSSGEIVFAANLPSAEGPLKGSEVCRYPVKTYGPLRLLTKRAHQRFSDRSVFYVSARESALAIDFNNRIDPSCLSAGRVSVSPEVDNFHSTVAGNQIIVVGEFRSGVNYKVVLDGRIADKFGQSLGNECVVKLRGVVTRSNVMGDDFISLAPEGPLQYRVHSAGKGRLKLNIWKVSPNYWTTFNFLYRQGLIGPIGILCGSKTLTSDGTGVDTTIDLKPYIASKYGHYVIEEQWIDTATAEGRRATRIGEADRRAEDTITNDARAKYVSPTTQYRWVQITDLAMDTFGSRHLQTLISSLTDGKPLEGVDVFVCDTEIKTLSNKLGLASIELPPFNVNAKRLAWTLVAQKGDDSCLITIPAFLPRALKYRWYAVSDRILYKPGETVKIKGWLRAVGADGGASRRLTLPQLESISYKLLTANSLVLLEGQASVDSMGGFAFDVPLPADLDLGSCMVMLQPPLVNSDEFGFERHDVRIMIDDFRRPEFEINLSSESKNPVLLGEQCKLHLGTRYFNGGGLANTPVKWQVRLSPSYFSPPSWDGFEFYSYRVFDHIFARSGSVEPRYLFENLTDKNGSSRVGIRLDQKNVNMPISLNCEATVSDLNRQVWTDRLNAVVLPSQICLGMRCPDKDCVAGGEVVCDIVATDVKGDIKVGTAVEVEIKEYGSDNKLLNQSKRALTIAGSPYQLKYQSSLNASRLVINADALDATGRVSKNFIAIKLNASDKPKSVDDRSFSYVRRDHIELKMSADKPSYRAGDIAKVTIKSPVYPITGLYLILGGSDSKPQPLTISSAVTEISVPIVEDYYPNVDVRVHANVNRKDFAEGSLSLDVPPVRRGLSVCATPGKGIYKPGDRATIDVALKDSEQKPVSNAQVAVMVVDDSVLALTYSGVQDPLDAFYRSYYRSIDSRHSRTQETGLWMMVANSRIAANSLPVIKGRIGESGGSNSLPSPNAQSLFPLLLRNNFSPLALFAPSLVTDVDGKATVSFTLPDNVTRYRVLAIAAAGNDKFGMGESSLTTNMPLGIKPSPPRFLHVGDRFELPVVLQNQTDHPLKTEIAIRSTNAVIKEPGRSIVIPAHDRVEVRFDGTATGLGKAYFQCAAVSGELRDSAEFGLPIYIPSTSMTVAASGSITSGVVSEQLAVPGDVYNQYGGLRLTTSSSAVNALAPAADYLNNYAYNCSEQVSSRLIARLSLRDNLRAFGGLSGDASEQFDQRIKQDVQLLQQRQRNNGSFALWNIHETGEWPFVTCQVTQALKMAQSKGYAVRADVLERALYQLKNIDKAIAKESDAPVAMTIRAYALFVRSLCGDLDAAAARKIATGEITAKSKDLPPSEAVVSDLSSEVAAWLLPILAKDTSCTDVAGQVRQLLYRRITETATTASVNPPVYGDDNYQVFGSQSRADALVLSALVDDQSGVQADSGLVPKLAKGLLNSRRNGIWGGTQENNVALYALSKYFERYEKDVPDCLTQAWLDNALVMQEQFKGRTTESKSVTVPMSYLQSNGAKTLEIAKRGAGRIYYNLALEYLPKTPPVDSDERGFRLARTYEPVNGKDDAVKDAQGKWHFKAGSTVRVRLRMEAPGARYHIVVNDPLPAGTESVNPKLNGGETYHQPADTPGTEFDPEFDPWRTGWEDHVNLRDQQTEVFSAKLPAGQYEYTYLIRATTPGDFVVPSAKVEEMYSSETYGTTAPDRVVVE